MSNKRKVRCPACNKVFIVDTSKIPEKGCHANCKECKNRFFIAGSTPSKAAFVQPKAKKIERASVPVKSEKKVKPVKGKPVKVKARDNRKPSKKAVPVKVKPEKSGVPANRKAVRGQNSVRKEKPTPKKNFVLIASFVFAIFLICAGAFRLLIQKDDFQPTKKDNQSISQEDNNSNVKEPPAGVQPSASTHGKNEKSQNNIEIKIGDLFKKVSPAVATVITYDSGDKPFKQGSGFFINQAGHLITNFHVLKGASFAVIKTSDNTEYLVKSILAENEKQDLIMLAIEIPEGNEGPGTWLDINDKQPNIADKIIVIGSPLGLGMTVSDGIISAIREIPDMGLVFQMTAPISQGSSGSPVIDMNGKVVGVSFFQIVKGQNLNFAIPGEKILALEQKQSLTVAAWTERINAEKDDKLDRLQKGILNQINPTQKEVKPEEESKPKSADDVLKAKLAYKIIKESGLAGQNQSFTEISLLMFELQYKMDESEKTEEDDKRFSKFKEIIRLATNPDRINDYIKKHLASNLTKPQLEQVLKWYTSPLGNKIAGVEYSSYMEKLANIKTLRLAFRLTRYQSTSRANLFLRLDEATNSTRAMVELQTNMIVQNQILDLILSDSKKPDQASIDNIIDKFKTDIDPYLDIFAAHYVFAGLVYTYRGISQSELEEYVSFSETTAARLYYAILNKKSNTIILENQKRIITSMIRVLDNDSWDNIEKDLKKPIKDT